MLEKGFLILTTVVWVPYGLMCFLDPAALAESTGVVASTPTASTEIRAMYGGLQIAIGLLAQKTFELLGVGGHHSSAIMQDTPRVSP